MVVGQLRTWGTIGGGNLEQAAVVHRPRADRGVGGGAGDERHPALRPGPGPARRAVLRRRGHAAVRAAAAGAVDRDLRDRARRHRAGAGAGAPRHRAAPGRLARGPARPGACIEHAVARVHRHHAVVPELVLGELPAGSHVLIMTHDHAEDAALCDAALRCGHLGSIGLIGSAVKWSRFARKLAAEGHDEAALARITTPIGLPDITGKQPATIAVSVAADLLRAGWSAEAAEQASRRGGRRIRLGRRRSDRLPRHRPRHPRFAVRRRRAACRGRRRDRGGARRGRRPRPVRAGARGPPGRRGGRPRAAACCCPAWSTRTCTSRRSG